VEIKLVKSPEGAEESFVLCRSDKRSEKENAILNRFVRRMQSGLEKLTRQAEKGTLKDSYIAGQRIGRLLERNSRAASLFVVSVEETGVGKEKRLRIRFRKNRKRYDWAAHTAGNYLLRTNWSEQNPHELWKTYIQLTQVEDAFRVTKSDLCIRPIYHHRQDRTQAHILVCFLALVLWRTLQQWMSASGLGTAPRKLLEELHEIRSMDVLLPTREKTLRLRLVATAPQRLKVLLHYMKLPLPNRPKVLENVVGKMAL
jgi:transposase